MIINIFRAKIDFPNDIDKEKIDNLIHNIEIISAMNSIEIVETNNCKDLENLTFFFFMDKRLIYTFQFHIQKEKVSAYLFSESLIEPVVQINSYYDFYKPLEEILNTL